MSAEQGDLLRDATRAFFASHPVPRGATLSAAVSGGADSLALLHALAEMRADAGFHLRVAHLHHGMRAEADADVAALSSLCDSLGVPLDVGYADVPEIARERRLSLEVAGRVARYDFFYRAAAAHNVYGICTGHTRDDQAETVLLRVIVGAGLEGLAGIAPARLVVPPESRSPVWLLRPILRSTRADTMAFCRERGLTPVNDPYNADPAYPRNLLRRDVLPLLARDFNPAVSDALARLADIARDENDLLENLAAEAVTIEADSNGVWMYRTVLLQLPPALQRRAARQLLRATTRPGPAMRYSNVERILEAAATGRPAQLRGGLTVSVVGDEVRLDPTPPMPDR